MHTVIETPGFIADAKKSGLTEDERSAIVNTLAQNPTAGHEIKGTGGARKVRFPARGRGKSGGYVLAQRVFKRRQGRLVSSRTE